MPRLKPLSVNEAPEAARPILAAAEARLGRPSVPGGVVARCPVILEAGRGLSAAPGQSGTLPAEMRALVCERVALMVGCLF